MGFSLFIQVTDLVFLETSKKLVSSSKDSQVRVWDLDTQSCVQRIVSHRTAVWALDVDASERHLVTGSADSELRVFTISKSEVSELMCLTSVGNRIYRHVFYSVEYIKCTILQQDLHLWIEDSSTKMFHSSTCTLTCSSKPPYM